MTENSETYRIVRKMIESGNQPGVIQLWKNMVEHWAMRSASPDAESVKAWLPSWQARPFYTARELAPIFPALAIALGVSKFMGRLPPAKSPARLERELQFAKLPMLENTHGQHHFQNPITGASNIYFIVERLHYWSRRQTTRFEFEREFHRGS